MKKRSFLLFLIFLLCLSACSPSSFSETMIYVLEVGKADCIVIQTEDHVAMIDTGEEENLPEILAFLEQKEIDTIDTLILTHFDKDHIGGAAGILAELSVSTVIQSAFSGDRPEYQNYLEALSKKNISPLCLTAVYEFSLNDCRFSVFPPQKDQYSSKEDNNASLVVSLENEHHSFLFCGDAMEERLEEILSLNLGQYDFVKLPYHGNHLGNYSEFLSAVSPEFAAITCSQKNPANQKTLDLLAEHGIKVYQTSNGTVSIRSSEGKLEFAQ